MIRWRGHVMIMDNSYDQVLSVTINGINPFVSNVGIEIIRKRIIWVQVKYHFVRLLLVISRRMLKMMLVYRL
jgi:hypothetical protein